MMAVRTVFNLFSDCWHLYRKYIVKALNEDDLDGFIQESGDLFQKYGQDSQDPFVKDLLLAVINEIERVERERNISDKEKGHKPCIGKDNADSEGQHADQRSRESESNHIADGVA